MASAGRRVLIIVQNLPVPFDRRVWLEATTLAAHGYEVSVICPKLKGFNRSYERLEDVDIYRYRLPIDPSTKLGFILEFAWAWIATAALSLKVHWRGRGFDVIQACNPPDTYWLLARLWRLAGRRFIFDHHDLSPEMYQAKFGSSKSFLGRLLLWLERMTFAAADISLATNQSHRDLAVLRGGMHPDNVFIVRSGPDIKRLTVYQPDDSYKNGKKHLIAYLGDISRQDGLDGLIGAVGHLASMRDDFHVIVIGGGSAWEEVKELAVATGVSSLFTFAGTVTDEELCRILSSATLATDPTPRNPWSERSTMNKIMEYMFFGLPIVAHDLQETRLSAQRAVSVTHTGLEEEFAMLMSDLLDDESLRRSMGEAGRQRLHDQLSWQHSTPHLLAAYRRVTPD